MFAGTPASHACLVPDRTKRLPATLAMKFPLIAPVLVVLLGTVCLAPAALHAAGDIGDALAPLRADELGLWVGVDTVTGEPDVTKDNPAESSLVLRLRNAKRVDVIAGKATFSGQLSLRVGGNRFVNQGSFVVQLEPESMTLRLEADRLMPAGADAMRAPLQDAVNGHFTVVVKISDVDRLILKRAEWTRADGTVIDLLLEAPARFTSPVGIRLGWVPLE